MTDREKFEAEKLKTEKIKTEREFYFKINTMRYDFAKQRYIALMPILVAALGLIPFAIDRLNILPILKTFIVFLKHDFYYPSLGELLVGAIIPFFFLFYVVFVCLALHTTYSCLLDLEKYLERQAETKDCEIRKLQSNTDKEREEIEKIEEIEKKRQECENDEKKARENYEEEKGKLSYYLLGAVISAMLCIVFSVIHNINVWEHKAEKKMASDQNSNMECLGLTIENPKPKDSKDDTKK
ncbi:hypothetical protein KVE62_06205 [Helicobacter pylori]|nr:hypothetical protein KVE62_06205 [Helicobacter pylori]